MIQIQNLHSDRFETEDDTDKAVLSDESQKTTLYKICFKYSFVLNLNN